MLFVSKAALAAMLGATVALAPVPADAQRKKQEKPAPVQISDAVRAALVAGQEAEAAGNLPEAERQLAVADAAASSDAEKFYAANLRLAVGNKKKDRVMMATAIDQLLASPQTAADKRGLLNFNRGEIALASKQPDQALRFFEAAKTAGYNDPDYDIRVASIEIDRNPAAGLAAIDRAAQARKTAGQPVPASWYDLAIARTYKTNPDAAAAWMRRELADYPTQANWNKALILFRDRADKGGNTLPNGVRLDLLRLMREAKAMSSQADYADYARLTGDMGLPYETVAVIDEGRANGKIPASATVYTQARTSAQAAIRAEGGLSSFDAKAKAAANGRIAANTGNAYLASGNAAKAIEMFQLAQQKGGVDADELNTRLGIALARAGRTAEAKQAFASVKGAPRAEVASFWSLWLDTPKSGATAAATTGA